MGFERVTADGSSGDQNSCGFLEQAGRPKEATREDACKLSSAQEGCLGTEAQVVQGPLS